MGWSLNDGWKEEPKFGVVSIHGQSKFFNLCEKTIPYLPFIFKNRRQRVKCRWFFRYHWWRKVEKQIVDYLQQTTAKPYNWEEFDTDFYWEITTKKASS